MFRWTDERVDKLKAMHKEGLSFSIIGERLGASRNAVIGKAHRLGLCKPSPSLPAMSARRTTKRKPDITKPKVITKPSGFRFGHAHLLPDDRPTRAEAIAAEDLKSRRIAFGDLETKHCRWPHDDLTYCGCDHVPGTSWCEAHLKIITAPPKTRPPAVNFNPDAFVLPIVRVSLKELETV